MTPPLSARMHYLTAEVEEGYYGFHEESAKVLDFSGKEAFVFYKEIMSKRQLLFSMNINNAAICQQLLFHGMFRIYVEDFGVHYFMTNALRWMRRSEQGMAFQTIKGFAAAINDDKAVLRFVGKLRSIRLRDCRLKSESNLKKEARFVISDRCSRALYCMDRTRIEMSSLPSSKYLLNQLALRIEMDPKRFYGRAIPSDSEDSELSGSDDDPEYIAPDCGSLNDSTNESSACSDEDEATPNGGNI
ncbi:hypothetical protein MRX96_029651 [Rhipicephalus microplus]